MGQQAAHQGAAADFYLSRLAGDWHPHQPCSAVMPEATGPELVTLPENSPRNSVQMFSAASHLLARTHEGVLSIWRPRPDERRMLGQQHERCGAIVIV